MTRGMKKNLYRIIIAFVGLLLGMGAQRYLSFNPDVELILYIIIYVIIGHDVIKGAAGNIIKGQVFDENFLMSIATVGAFLVGEYPEAVGVMLFYQVGELFQSYAVHRSRKSISELMDIRPDYANIKEGDAVKKVSPEEVQIGAVMVIKPGEKVPLDGTVLEGSTSLDTAALTGEAMPKEVGIGDFILSGSININGYIEVQVDSNFAESTVSKILDLVENAGSKKADSEKFITKFARYYTPGVVIFAVLLAVLPPLLWDRGNFSDWVYRALTFLVISCPCALVISIPLSFFGGLGGASRNGILIKGSNYLEALAHTEMVVFDKTGTLTKGNFKVEKKVSGISGSLTEAEVLEAAAYAECYSNHPISLSIQKAYGGEINKERVTDVSEIAGYGLKVKFDDKTVLAGNEKLMRKENINFQPVREIGTVIHLAVNGIYEGYLVVADEIKESAKSTIEALKKAGINDIYMLTGDRKETAVHVAEQLGIDKVYAELLPGDKVDIMESLLHKKTKAGKLLFTGDGINDAPVLARADIGIAMGGVGSDAAIEAADMVLMTDEPIQIIKGIEIAKKTQVIVKQNIIFALGIKFGVLLLAAMGMTTMWAAVFADVGVSVIAICNAMRAMGRKL